MDEGEIKVIDCPTEKMWADIMTKPLQGIAFRTMQAELMNCPVNYEEPEETIEEKGLPISAAKMVTWKSDVRTTFKTPQECVGQNGNHKGKPVMDRRPRNSYQGSKGTRGMLSKSRLVSRRGLIGVSREKRAKQ